jgi:hypothetical protein
MTTRDVADGKSHGQYRKPEGQGHAQESNSHVRESRRQHRAAASSQNKPESAEKFCAYSLCNAVHLFLLFMLQKEVSN